MGWCPLQVHSQYSILDATPSVDEIAARAAADGFSAVALTDHDNLYGAVEFYKSCKKHKVKAIIGCELTVALTLATEKSLLPGCRSGYSLVLLVQNEIGYCNLCALVSKAHLEGFYYTPRVDRELLTAHASGLLCLAGGLNSRLAHELLRGEEASFHEEWEFLRNLFQENFYVALQRHPMSNEEIAVDQMSQEPWLIHQLREHLLNEEKVNAKLLAMAQRDGVRYVATNDSHYLDREGWRAHEILINIQSGEPAELLEGEGSQMRRRPNPKRTVYPTHSYHFPTRAAMDLLFHDLPEALITAEAIAEKCQFSFDCSTRHYPIYLPKSLENTLHTEEERKIAVEQLLRSLCEEGIPKRYGEAALSAVTLLYPERPALETISQRLERELEVIFSKGMCDYLLIVWDFIHWAKQQKIPVGPGRGSGAGSIILYLIGITDIEPLRFNLFFERFINPERPSYPDIDVDICMERRGEVIRYALEKYGRQSVAQIITFNTMKARMAIKDVGRVLNIPLAKVNQIAKLVPDDLNITLKGALEKDPDLSRLYQTDEETRRLLDVAQQLEGAVRSTGIHAAGVIICGRPLVELVPICVAKDSDLPATQFSMKPLEELGLLKIDFLGLTTLTAIQLCVDEIQKNHKITIDWSTLPLEDPATFSLLNRGKTMGVFQLESTGMQELAKNLHLDRFEEIISVGALYRPGPMEMIPSFIARKHGREPIEYDHPALKEILDETYGIMVYQEQVMAIACRLFGYSLGEGDLLRKAMGKKDVAEMERQREKCRKGAIQMGISEETALRIFEKIEKFASYGFNKSHATAYGYLTYVTAYLKANYPREWFAALMSSVSGDLVKVSKFLRECQSMELPVLPPDVNESGMAFCATQTGIRFAMTAVKGVGTAAVEAILKEREKGNFNSFYDFLKRIDEKKVSRKSIEQMVDAGCFDFTRWSRAALRHALPSMYEVAAEQRKEKAKGIKTLFDLIGNGSDNPFPKPPEVSERSAFELMMREKELLGLFIQGHPLDLYREAMRALGAVPLQQALNNLEESVAVIRTAFFIEEIQTRFSQKSKKKFAILKVSDENETWELPIWPESYERFSELLREHQLLCAVLSVEKEQGEEQPKLNCRWLGNLARIDDQMISDCDQAYTQAKSMTSRGRFYEKYGNKGNSRDTVSPASQEDENRGREMRNRSQSPQPIELHLDLSELSMQALVRAKDSLTAASGGSPLSLLFYREDELLATLELPARRSIAWSTRLEEQLRADFGKAYRCSSIK